jgi:thermitase
VDLSSEETVLDGAEVVVAVIDSGVDGDHPIFENHTVLDGFNTFNSRQKAFDDVGHGTHIAGIIAMRSPQAVIAPYKIVDANGGRLSNVLWAFDRAISDDVDIINTSFGLLSPSYSLASLVRQADQQGIWVISAAGNNNNSLGFYPGTYEETLAIASVKPNGEKLTLSNYGSWVDLAANGYFVRSALPNGRYGPKSGTSQATALVSGAAAEWRAEFGEASLEELFEYFVENGQLIEEGKLAGLSIVE